MTGPGPRLLALLLVMASVGAGCTQETPEPDPDVGLAGCEWAARFTDEDAYGTLKEVPPNASGPSVNHLPGRFGHLPFENRTLEAEHGPLRLKRILHASDAPAIANPPAALSGWRGIPAPQGASVDSVEAGFRVESEQERVQSYGDDAFVVFVTGTDSEARIPIVDFLGQVTGANETNRIAWADQALENRTPVEGEPYDRVEIAFENPDSDLVYPGVEDRNLTLRPLYEDLTTNATIESNREPGRLVVDVDDWWWVFQLEHILVRTEAGDDGLESQLVVDRGGEAGLRVQGSGSVTQDDLHGELSDIYEALDLGEVPATSFHTVEKGSACPA